MSISPVVRRARKFQDLLSIPGGDGPYVFTRIFRESDRRERRRSRRTLKLLKKVDGRIRAVVGSREKVLLLTEGRGLSFWERWVLGWRQAVVLTDRRAILLQLDAARRPRIHHRQLTYNAITGVQKGSWGKVEIGTRSGEIVELRGVRRSDREVLMDRLRSGANAFRGDGGAGRLQNLCPHCHRGIPGNPSSCPRCLRDFRTWWTSALSSLLTPGLGNYLLGYRGIAVLEFLMAVAIWTALFLPPEQWVTTGIVSAVGPVWILATVHGSDAIVTWYAAREGVFPSGEA